MARVTSDVAAWFGDSYARTLRFLRVYRIPFAQPNQEVCGSPLPFVLYGRQTCEAQGGLVLVPRGVGPTGCAKDPGEGGGA